MATAAEKEPVGMQRKDLRRMLKLARKNPIHAAFALGGDGKPIVVLDKRKQPRALGKSIKDKAPDAKNHNWGTVSIDPDEPKLARFVVSRPASGMARRLVIALKGTGCNKVQIALEDGTEVEACEGEPEEDQEDQDQDDQEDQEDQTNEASADGDESTRDDYNADSDAEATATSSSDSAPADGEPDAATLTATLTALVKRMMKVIANDPSQKAGLAELATDAQASLKRGDLAQAAAGIEILRRAIESASGQTSADEDPADIPITASADPAHTDDTAPQDTTSTNGSDPQWEAGPSFDPKDATDGSAPPAAPPPAAAAQIAKARVAWRATRQKVEKDLGGLHDAFATAFKGHDIEADLTKAFRSRVDTVLDTLDEKLSDKLEELNNAIDAARRSQLVQEAHRILEDYQNHVANDQTIAALDNNPFVSLSVQKTMVATLTALSKAIK